MLRWWSPVACFVSPGRNIDEGSFHEGFKVVAVVAAYATYTLCQRSSPLLACK